MADISNIEAADMAESAAQEIEHLRATNAALAPKADAYDTLAAVVRLIPGQVRGYSEDIAWRLRKRAEELRAKPIASTDDA